MNYSEEQEAAILLGIDKTKKLVGITGAAGTGKTTIIGEMIREGDFKMPALVAPTGRAAKRIQEATGIDAKTIHRFMRYSMPAEDDEAGMPTFDKSNKFPHDAVIVDESSMVSEDLYRALIDAMRHDCVIRFIGDANQLPPVESTSPFVKILEKWPSVRLTKNFRSGDGIVTAANQIIANRVPEPNEKFRMLNPGNGNILPALDQFVDDSFRGLNGQVITPTRVGKYGTQQLNRYFQQRLNPNGPVIEIRIDDEEVRRFRRGDKVIQTKNDYKLNIFNGMIGWITDIIEDDIIVNFEDRDICLPPHMEAYDPFTKKPARGYDPRRNLDLAYAVTTHKAQGSEFDRVVILIQRSYVLNRANFYTAVTRAKEQCTVICGPGALAMALHK